MRISTFGLAARGTLFSIVGFFLFSTPSLAQGAGVQLPLAFEENRGQADGAVRFIAHGRGGTAFFAKDHVVLVAGSKTASHSLTMRFVDSSGESTSGEQATGGFANYYSSRDSSQWLSHIPMYGKLRYREVYPGIDVAFHGHDGQLEYDLEIAPGRTPDRVKMEFSGADHISVTQNGSLEISKDGATWRLLPPNAFEKDGAVAEPVQVKYRLLSKQVVGLQADRLNSSLPLIIDPVVQYATYVGAGAEIDVSAVQADAAGNLFVAGQVGGGMYVTKLNATGDTILYATNIPVSSTSTAMAIDTSGNAYVVGITSSPDFPLTSTNLGTCGMSCNAGFVTKFDSTGALVYSTLTASGQALPRSIVVDGGGSAYITGDAYDSTLHTVNAYQPTFIGIECTSCSNGFFAKLNADGTGYLFSSYFMGVSSGAGEMIGWGVALDSTGNIYLAGTTDYVDPPPMNPWQLGVGGLWVAKFASDGQTLLFSTRFGGSSFPNNDTLTGIKVGSDGTIYLTGDTQAGDYPYSLVAAAHQQAPPISYTENMFATAIDPTLTHLVYSTYLGNGWVKAMALDSNNHLYLAGQSGSSYLPLQNAVVSDISTGGYLLSLDASGMPVYASQFGGHLAPEVPTAIAVDSDFNTYIAGGIGSPIGTPIQPPDPVVVGPSLVTFPSSASLGFMAKIGTANLPQISLNTVAPFLTLRNAGSADLHITSVVLGGALVKQWGNCGTVIPAGTSCALTVSDGSGLVANGTVTITSDAVPSVQTFSTTSTTVGQPVGDHFWFDDAVLGFPPQMEGAKVGPIPLNISNVGTANGTITSISSYGASQTNSCPSTLAPGAKCTIQATFTASYPTEGGNISIVYDGYYTQTYRAQFAAVSQQQLLISLQSINFGTQVVQGIAIPRVVTLTNTGNNTITAPAASIQGDPEFSIVGNTCNSALAPHQSCSLAVQFQPTVDGTPTATLSIAGQGGSGQVPLSGTGSIASIVQVAPLQLLFGNVVVEKTTHPQPLTLTNTSSAPVKIKEIAFSLPDYSQSNNCSGEVPANGSCTVQVAITAHAIGSRQGDITITFANAVAQVVTLQATGIAPLQLSPTSLDFGPNTPVHTTSATQYIGLGNGILGTPSQKYSIAITGDFVITSNPCPNPMPSLLGCSLQVAFQPKTAGQHSGTIIVSFPDISEQAVATLTGATPGPLTFVPVTPCRIADTRPYGGAITAGTWRDFSVVGVCGIPQTAAAYSMNVTVVPQQPLGFLSIYPTGDAQPTTSVLNSYDGRVKANAAIVPAGADEQVRVFASGTTDVILDINGYFTSDTSSPATELQFYPLTPCRVVDTRKSTFPPDLGPPSLPANTARSFPMKSSPCGIPSEAQAYSLNFTVVPHASLGFMTAWPSDQPQTTASILNSYSGQVVANAAIVPAAQDSAGSIDVLATSESDVIIDINGYFAPSSSSPNGLVLYASTPCRALDTRKTTGPISGNPPTMVAIGSGPCGVLPSSGAYVLNATAIPTAGTLGFLSLWPNGLSQPNVSTTNAYDGAVVSNMAVVPVSNGGVDAFASNPANLLLDLSSYFAAPPQ